MASLTFKVQSILHSSNIKLIAAVDMSIFSLENDTLALHCDVKENVKRAPKTIISLQRKTDYKLHKAQGTRYFVFSI